MAPLLEEQIRKNSKALVEILPFFLNSYIQNDFLATWENLERCLSRYKNTDSAPIKPGSEGSVVPESKSPSSGSSPPEKWHPQLEHSHPALGHARVSSFLPA